MKFLKSFSFKKLLYNRRFTIPFSIFLSFVFWILITVNQKPIIQRTFADMGVAVNMENTFAEENDMSIIGDISKQRFTVHVMGQNHIVTALTSADISLYASAAAVDSPGEYSLTVSAKQNNGDFDVVSITPKTVKVSFDYMETRQFTVNAIAEGAAAASGLISEPAVVSGIEGNAITITGPRTLINSIDSVNAKVNVNKTLSSSETFDADIVLLDSEKRVIDTENLELSAEKVKITVPISKKKTVPVKVDFSNVPNGFDESSIKAKVNHSEITVIGTPEAVDKINEIPLSPIDITSINSNSSKFEVSAKFPEGVRIFESVDSFVVTLNLNNYAEKTITVSRIKYTGLAEGLQNSSTASIRNVKICGPASAINRLSSTSAYAEIDLTNKKAGEHAVTAKINFEGYNNVWAVGSYETSVTIK